jgi:ribokinase
MPVRSDPAKETAVSTPTATSTPSSPPPANQTGLVTVVGSLNVDLTVRTDRFPQPGETLAGSELVTAPGGKGSNQAAAAAILGSRVRLVGAVGNDAQGAFLLESATSVGVAVTGVQRLSDHATGSAMIVVNAEGENTIIVSAGANSALTAEAVTPEALEGTDVLCLCLEIPVATVQGAAQAGHDAGARVLLNLSPFQQVPAELFALTDVLLVNRAEAAQVLGSERLGDDWAEALARFTDLGLERVVVTLGADGAVVLDGSVPDERNRVTGIDPVRVEVVDTTGCGDAFTGAMAHRLACGATLVEAAEFAGQVSALAATAAGAQSSYQAFADVAAR